jgi:putative salt-induced outer membrane protein YdiY
MKKILLTTLLALCSTPVLAGTTKVNLGANIIDGKDITSNINVEHIHESGRWRQEYEVEHDYQHVTGKVGKNDFYGLAKANYALDKKNYVLGVVKYEYDHFLSNQHNAVAAVGYGHKILRTDTLRVSNEVSGGVMRTDTDTKPVLRNSLWIRYDDKKYVFINKMLLEYTDFMYVRNQTELGYKVTNRVTVGIRNVFTRNTQRDSNVTLINLGLTL